MAYAAKDTSLSLSLSRNKKRIFRSIGEGWNDKARRMKKEGRGEEKDGWMHLHRRSAAGNIDSTRFDFASRQATVTIPIPVEWQSNRGFEICVAVLHDSGPGPRASDIEMAHAAPIVRIDDVKSLEPRQFCADFTLPDPG